VDGGRRQGIIAVERLSHLERDKIIIITADRALKDDRKTDSLTRKAGLS
jgi:hypothetical protein